VEEKREWMIYDSSFCPKLDFRSIPEEKWLYILKRFQSTPSLPEVAVAFVVFNEPEPMGK